MLPVAVMTDSFLGTGLVDCGGDVRLARGIGCPVRDGTVLRSDHYLPPGSEDRGATFPVLLMRQPYGRDIASTVVYRHPAWFARRGYHVVIQDVRGRGDSDGEFYPFRTEGADGFDTVQWAAALPGSNGRVGMYGFSYQGMTQLLAAAEGPPALACIAPAMTAADLYRGWFYQRGALRLASTLGWGIQMLKANARRAGLRDASDALEAAWANLRAVPWQLPPGDPAAARFSGLPTYLADWLAHHEPGAYWEAQDISTRYDRITVPALHVAGWYDTYGQASVDGYRALRRAAGTDHARDNQFLVAGPWVHIPWSEQAGDEHFGPAACLDTDALLVRWLDHWLKEPGGWSQEPRARIFVLGTNRWQAVPEYPPVEPVEAIFYLRGNGAANSRQGDGTLDPEPPGDAGEPPDLFIYDPEVPVLAPGGPDSLGGPFDQSRLEAGNNVLVYTSAPLTENRRVCGEPRLRLHAATSAAPTDFCAKLVRVEPGGRARHVCLGYARSTAMFPAGEHRPDVVCVWDFTLDATACEFAAGERVRLEIASSAFPLFDRHPNTGAVPPVRATAFDWRRSTQTVFHDALRPSTLVLPTIPADPASFL